MTELLIFDWDGTLSDSLSRIAFCMQRAAEDCDLEPLAEQQVHEIVGLGLREALQQLYPLLDDDALIASVIERYSHHFVNNDQVPSPFYPYVMESLQAFRDQGYQLAVATGKSRRGLNRVLKEKGLEGFFHGSRCADETRSKPHPLMINELLAEFRLQPNRAVMVGDTEYDMEMAQRAGVPRLAVSYGAHSRDRLQRYQPFATLDCFSMAQDAIRDYKVALSG